MIAALLVQPSVPRPRATLPEEWIAWLTFVMMVIAIAQAIFFFQQLEMMRASLEDAKAAARAAEIANQTMRIAYRANVHLDA